MSNHSELIDKYFEGQLTEEERIIFDEMMASNQHFRESVEFQIKTKKAFQNHERKSLKSLLGQIEEDILESEKGVKIKKIKSRNLWPFLIAAVLISVIAITFFIKRNIVSSDNEYPQDFYAYYEAYPNVVKPITRGEAINPDELEKAAFLAYESQDFKLADSLFSILLDQQKEYLLFYKGITKIELEQYDSATTYFENYIYSDGMQFRDQAKWYMALSYLVKGDSIKGKEELIKLRKSSGYKMEEVEQLLLRLD
ncbi:hypothetical protein MM239_08720 [Belliella sp. DSM 111904]|uniref:Tetratricopeptide repeat-containing protein n=1 Tax=Belliella filtrata TaxID=2923435 RepID=A0ABS9UZ86_9BACT|nr:hypothetical protein [Belliella filtrata]MCH7409475.1 hypothetical protein [Belliella filtrata]